jgi:hypothetical protein
MFNLTIFCEQDAKIINYFPLLNNSITKVIKVKGCQPILPLDLIYTVEQVPEELLGEYSAPHTVADVPMTELPSQDLTLQPLLP